MAVGAYKFAAAMSRSGRFPKAPLERIGAEVACLTLGDADLHIEDMQVLHCGNVVHPDAMPGPYILKRIGHGGAVEAVLASKKRMCRMGFFPSNIRGRPRSCQGLGREVAVGMSCAADVMERVAQ